MHVYLLVSIFGSLYAGRLQFKLVSVYTIKYEEGIINVREYKDKRMATNQESHKGHADAGALPAVVTKEVETRQAIPINTPITINVILDYSKKIFRKAKEKVNDFIGKSDNYHKLSKSQPEQTTSQPDQLNQPLSKSSPDLKTKGGGQQKKLKANSNQSVVVEKEEVDDNDDISNIEAEEFIKDKSFTELSLFINSADMLWKKTAKGEDTDLNESGYERIGKSLGNETTYRFNKDNKNIDIILDQNGYFLIKFADFVFKFKNENNIWLIFDKAVKHIKK
jgi:hypothetical protein